MINKDKKQIHDISSPELLRSFLHFLVNTKIKVHGTLKYLRCLALPFLKLKMNFLIIQKKTIFGFPFNKIEESINPENDI